MLRLFCVLVLSLATAVTAQGAALPSCRALLPAVQQSPASVHEDEPLLGVDAIVEDWTSSKEVRICTGIARYRSASTHITYAARWQDAEGSGVTITTHSTTFDEAVSRARSLRIRNHPSGDGSFTMRMMTPYCSDPVFVRQATLELHYGISVEDAFFQEPDYTIFDMETNGNGSGVMANCIATVGDDKLKGDIFLGTNWVRGQAGRRFEFYALAAGPLDFRLTNRLWELSAE